MNGQSISGSGKIVVSLVVAASLSGLAPGALAERRGPGNAGRPASWRSAEQGAPPIEESRRQAEANPQDAVAQNDLGWALRQSGDLPGAERALRRAIKLNPNMPQARSNLAVVLADQKRPAEAVAEARQAVTLDPEQPVYHVVLGNALLGQGDAGAAIEEYRKAVAQKADYENARFHLGEALYRKGEVTAAKVELSYALKLDPNDARALELMDRIMSGEKR